MAGEPLEEIAGTRRVCAGGPGEAVARAQRARGEAGVVASQVLPNPSLRAEHQGTLSNVSNGEETILGVSVLLPIGGRRSLHKEAAQARREKALADARATLFESALAFREAYVVAATDQAKVEVLAEQQQALERLGTTVAKLAKGGEASGYDLARQQMQARLHRRILESARAEFAGALRLLEAWTGTSVELRPVELANLAGGAVVSPEGLPAARHPRVDSLEAESLASSYDARAARRRWVPDLDLFAGYRTSTSGSNTDHGFAVTLSVPLTLFDHGQGEAAQAEAEGELARSTAEMLRRQNESARRSAASRLAVLEAGQRDLEQAASDALAIQTNAARLYAAGEGTITELIDAFRTSEEARLGRIDLARETANARLSLMRFSGTQFDAGLDKECGGAAGAPR
ncbi:MAG: TolC family protein [Myxococcales bacterium]